MDIATVIRTFWQRPDPRPPEQVEDDLDAEFNFHIAASIEEFQAAGLDPLSARDAALQRFGDVNAVKARCRRIANQERIMLQRFNLAAMIIVLLAVIGVSTQMFITQRHNTIALQTITAELVGMKAETQAAARMNQQQQPVSQPFDITAGPHILIEGDITTPKWLPISLDPATTVRELLTNAAVSPDAWVSIRQPSSPTAARQYIRASVYLNEQSGHRIVRPSEEFRIVKNLAETHQFTPPLSNLVMPREWIEDAADQPRENRRVLRITSALVTNVIVIGASLSPSQVNHIYMQFENPPVRVDGQNVRYAGQVRTSSDARTQHPCQWNIEGNRLHLQFELPDAHYDMTFVPNAEDS